DFAAYIVGTGGADGINIFELAYENTLKPYQYGVSKAYELTSCFEGLLEYYYETGVEKYRTAVVNYAHAVLETEISVIGSCGITHELFDHTRTRQTVKQDEVAQEICVTVTWMKFCARLFELTGESLFIDCMEQSFFNSYLGAFNIDKKHSDICEERFERGECDRSVMPVDSYSPLVPGKRGLKTGGYQVMPDKSYYGCCACIAAAGVGMYMKEAVCVHDGAVYVNFFEKGSAEFDYDGAKVTICMDTDYPVSGRVDMHITADKPVTFTLRVRVPGWTGSNAGYEEYTRCWQDDAINMNYDMPIRVQYPETWEEDVVYTGPFSNPKYIHGAGPVKVFHKPEEDDYVCLMRGPITLAADSRMGKDADSVFDFEPVGELCADAEIVPGVDCMVKMAFTDKNGEEFHLVDYASAGRDWETTIAAWLPVPHRT
ncbi:MAG: glycoside hydrolase family 127 protein, partial [Clostridia bacterium]|nr:glycoside hydrolase family 127 protein [Clostridia bacterium]